MKRINITHATVAIAVAAAIAASAALAGDKPKTKSAAPAAAQPARQSFANVQVENASPELVAKLAAEQTSASAMRAYVDSAGKFRGPTQEEIAADNAAAPKARAAARSAFARSAAPAAAQATRTAGGLTAYDLGESTMVYSVATVDANGKLKEDCVTGAKNASNAALDLARTEVANEK